MSNDMLSIGASGARAYQGALTTVSENIANVGSPGYSRRTATLAEVIASGANVGLGVRVEGIARSADPYRAADVRRAGSDFSRTATGVDFLTRIESALAGPELRARITDFFNAAVRLAANPATEAPRAAMLEAGISAANAFSATGNALDQLVVELDAKTIDATRTLNNMAAVLGKVNDSFGRTAPGSDAAANLADQRDAVLETMSSLTDMAVQIDDFGRATVRLGGSNGPVLVSGEYAGIVTAARDVNGATSFAVHRAATVSAFTPSGGALAGIADASSRILDNKALLAAVATDFTNQVNAVQAAGQDLDGNAGAPIFAQGSDPLQVTMVLANGRGIAAAATGVGPRDNSNLLAFSAIRTSGNYEGRITDLASGNAAALSSRRTVAQAQDAIRNSAVSARDAASGVDLDNEAVDLMRFQQAYQASSRVIQIARDTLQSILDIR